MSFVLLETTTLPIKGLVTYSDDGLTYASSDPFNNNQRGIVFVKRYNTLSSSWYDLIGGSALVGTIPTNNVSNPGDRFGNFISLSTDGNRLLVHSIHDNIGRIDIFDWNNITSTWSNIFNIEGANINVGLGLECAVLSPDGNHFAFGSLSNDNTRSLHIYSLKNGTWTNTLFVLNTQENRSCIFSNDGNTFFLGNTGYYNNPGTGWRYNVGQVRVWRYNLSNNNWSGKTTISNPDNNDSDYFGFKIKCSSDGNIIAISAPGADVIGKSNCGKVYVYTTSNNWTNNTRRDTIVGNNSSSGLGNLGLDLSTDGTMLAIGSATYDSVLSNVSSLYSQALLFSYINSSWQTVSIPSSLNWTFISGTRYYYGNYLKIYDNNNKLLVGKNLDGNWSNSRFSDTVEKYGILTLSDLIAAGYTATQLKAAGYTASELKNAGFTVTQLRAAGFTASELKTAGFTASELKTAEFSATELKTAGFTASELKVAEFSATELKTAGFTATELKTAGFNATGLKAAGFNATELKTAGFTASELKNAGFTVTQLKAAGFTASELKVAGFIVTELKVAGFNVSELKVAGFTITELQSVFPLIELRSQYTLEELVSGFVVNSLFLDINIGSFNWEESKLQNKTISDLLISLKNLYSDIIVLDDLFWKCIIYEYYDIGLNSYQPILIHSISLNEIINVNNSNFKCYLEDTYGFYVNSSNQNVNLENITEQIKLDLFNTLKTQLTIDQSNYAIFNNIPLIVLPPIKDVLVLGNDPIIPSSTNTAQEVLSKINIETVKLLYVDNNNIETKTNLITNVVEIAYKQEETQEVPKESVETNIRTFVTTIFSETEEDLIKLHTIAKGVYTSLGLTPTTESIITDYNKYEYTEIENVDTVLSTKLDKLNWEQAKTEEVSVDNMVSALKNVFINAKTTTIRNKNISSNNILSRNTTDEDVDDLLWGFMVYENYDISLNSYIPTISRSNNLVELIENNSNLNCYVENAFGYKIKIPYDSLKYIKGVFEKHLDDEGKIYYLLVNNLPNYNFEVKLPTYDDLFKLQAHIPFDINYNFNLNISNINYTSQTGSAYGLNTGITGTLLIYNLTAEKIIEVTENRDLTYNSRFFIVPPPTDTQVVPASDFNYLIQNVEVPNAPTVTETTTTGNIITYPVPELDVYKLDTTTGTIVYQSPYPIPALLTNSIKGINMSRSLDTNSINDRNTNIAPIYQFQLPELGTFILVDPNAPSATELKNQGKTASELKQLGYNLVQLKEAGYTAKQLKDSNNYQDSEILSAGFSASQLKEAGYSKEVLLNNNYSKNELIIAGFTFELNQTELKSLSHYVSPISAKFTHSREDLSVVINIQDNRYTKSSGVSYCQDTGHVGVVTKFSVTATNTTNSQNETNFSNEPINVELTLPMANPNSSPLKLFKVDPTVFNNPKIINSNYPVSGRDVTYNSTSSKWETTLPSLSTFIIVDPSAPSGGAGGDPHVQTIHGEHHLLPNDWKLVKLYEHNDMKVVVKCEHIGDEVVEQLHKLDEDRNVIYINKDIHKYVTDLTYMTELAVLKHNEEVFKMNLLNNKVLLHNHVEESEIKLEKLEQENEEGLFSLTNKRVYPKQNLSSYLLHLDSNNVMKIQIDNFWDDINFVKLHLFDKEHVEEYFGEFFKHDVKNRLE